MVKEEKIPTPEGQTAREVEYSNGLMEQANNNRQGGSGREEKKGVFDEASATDKDGNPIEVEVMSDDWKSEEESIVVDTGGGDEGDAGNSPGRGNGEGDDDDGGEPPEKGGNGESEEGEHDPVDELAGSLGVTNLELKNILRKYARRLGKASLRTIEEDIDRVAEMRVPSAQENQVKNVLGFLETLGSEVKAREAAQKVADLEQMNRLRAEESTYSTKGAWKQLCTEVQDKDRLDINDRRQFLVWFRNLEYDMLMKRPKDAVDLEHYLKTTLGVYPISVEQILEALPENLHDLKEPLEAEMRFLSVTAIRRLQVWRTWGDLHKQVEQMAAFAEGGSLLTLGAAEWDKINRFAPEVVRRRQNGETDYSEDPVALAERFKGAVSAYLVMKMIWQDSADNMTIGPKGREAIEKLKTEYGYTDEELAWLREGNTNIFYKHHEITEGQARLVRAQIAIQAGGENPGQLIEAEKNFIIEHEKLDSNGSRNLRPHIWEAWKKGRLMEISAYNLMFSGGVAQYLDTTGAGDMGLNLLMQTSRYMATQAKSARAAASKEVIERVDRLVPDFFEAIHIGGEQLQTLFVDKGIRYSDIKWLTEGPENPDRQWGATLMFAVPLFDAMREDTPDNHINFGEIAQPAPGGLASSQTVINGKITRQIQALWKMAYLWTAVLQLKNTEHQIYRDKKDGECHPFDGDGKRLSLTREGRAKDTAFGLAKNVFRAILVQHMKEHAPQSVLGKLFGLGVSRGTSIKPEDETAILANLSQIFQRVEYDYSGRVVKRYGPLFTMGEVMRMLNEAGAGDVAWLRRTLGASG